MVLNINATAQTLVASYPFNGNANDATGNGNNGVVTGATLTTDRFGNANSAYSFNGSSNFIQVANSASLQLGSQFTIAAWSKLSAYNMGNYQGNFILSKGSDVANAMSFNLQVGEIDNNINPDPNGYKRLIFFNNPTGAAPYAEDGDIVVAPQIELNKWYYTVASVNGNVMKVYVNGSLVETKTFAATLNASNALDLFIGRQNLSGEPAYWWNGSLDDIKIYNGALTDAQVADSFATQSLVASYPFNGNANDASGNGHNATTTNATLTTDRFGNANSAYLFNGTSNYIQVPDAVDLRFTGPFTINAWVQPAGFYSADCQGNTIIQKGGYLSQNAFNLGYGDNILDGGNCSAYNPNKETFFGSYDVDPDGAGPMPITQYYSYDPNIVQLNKWYMVTEVYDGTNIKFYTNGKLQGSNTVTSGGGSPNTNDIFIGKFGTGDGSHPYWLNGKIDDISLYNGALSDAQIFDTYVNDLKKPGSGNAIQLTGTGSLATSPYINLGSGFDFGTQPFTYETWVKRDVISTTLNNYGKALLVGDNNGSWGIGIINDNTLFFTKVGVNFVASTGTIADTKWHHVAVVYTGTQVEFFIDGIAAGNPAYFDNFSNNSGNYFIGPRQSFGNSNGDGTLDGQIDETRIWRNVALSQTEIRDWMCKKITSAHPAYANLFAYYRLDEGSGTSTYRVGGHPGTLVNSPTWVTSGASFGDASAYDYTNATKTATLNASTGETFTVTNSTGAPDGLQIYRVDTIPNTTAGANSGVNNKYFGVFQVNGTSPTYTAVYNYNGNPLINHESDLRLFKRADNSITSWTDCGATLNTTSKTLTTTGQSTEYILGVVSGTLPVTLINFSGYKENATVKLNWQSENEINFSGYEIEKSTDGLSFHSIGSSTALHSAGINNYSFIDNTPVAGNNFYRLKQINADGKFTDSKIIKIDFSKKLSITILPNPAHNYININTSSVIQEVRLINLSGKLIDRWTNISGTSALDISKVASGVYILKIIASNEVQSQKLIKE